MSDHVGQVSTSNEASTDADLLLNIPSQGIFREKRLWAALFRDACEELGIIRADNQRLITYEDYRETVEWIEAESKEVGGSYYVIETIFENITPEEIFRFIRAYRCKCCDHLVMLLPCRNALYTSIPSIRQPSEAISREAKRTSHKKLRKH